MRISKIKKLEQKEARQELLNAVYERDPKTKDEKAYPYMMISVGQRIGDKGYSFFVVRDKKGKEAWDYLTMDDIINRKKRTRLTVTPHIDDKGEIIIPMNKLHELCLKCRK